MNLFLKELIMNLAVIAILGAFMDMILPSGNFKKYTRFILGIIVLALILQPILQLFGSSSSIGKYITQYEASMQNDILNHQSRLMKKLQEDQTKEMLSENLESQIESQVKRLGDYEFVDAKIIFSEKQGQEDLSEIERVYIDIGKASGKIVEPVAIKVSVGLSEGDESAQKKNMNPEEMEEIQNMISSFYDIPKDKIIISRESG